MQESIHWPKELHQTSIFLKVDISRAHERIDWIFLFQVMEKLGIINPFLNTMRALFQVMAIYVNIKNQVIQPFGLHRGGHHGCPLVPYLFIIIAEALNVVVKKH